MTMNSSGRIVGNNVSCLVAADSTYIGAIFKVPHGFVEVTHHMRPVILSAKRVIHLSLADMSDEQRVLCLVEDCQLKRYWHPFWNWSVHG